MTEGTILRYVTAIITVLLGASNTLFGTHFATSTIEGEFATGIALILAEILAIKGKNWITAASDMEKLLTTFGPLLKELLGGIEKVDSTGLKQIPDKQSK